MNLLRLVDGDLDCLGAVERGIMIVEIVDDNANLRIIGACAILVCCLIIVLWLLPTVCSQTYANVEQKNALAFRIKLSINDEPPARIDSPMRRALVVAADNFERRARRPRNERGNI